AGHDRSACWVSEYPPGCPRNRGFLRKPYDFPWILTLASAGISLAMSLASPDASSNLRGGPALNGDGSDRIAREILSYFLRNPQAADTVEGIVRWRLLNEAVHRKVDETRIALARLVESGYLIQTPQVGIDSIFMLNPEKRDDVQRLLNATEPPGTVP